MYKILSKLVDECWRYSKPNQCHFWAWLKRHIFGVLDSQGSEETLVRRGGITNYDLIAYSFSNISAKNYQNRLMCIEVIAKNVIVVFFWDTVYVAGPLPSKWVVAQFDSTSIILLRDWTINWCNSHHLQQETWHISSPFIINQTRY